MSTAPHLKCSSCDYACGLNTGRMKRHTMTLHFRKATAAECTPKTPTVDDVVQHTTLMLDPLDHLPLSLTPQVDPDGRLWAIIIGAFGFTRVDGAWCSAYPGTPVRPTRWVTKPEVLDALDRWELAHIPADADPTPPHGIGRPIPALVAMAGGV